jgi:hypothetical protein
VSTLANAFRDNGNVSFATAVLLSKDYETFATGVPSARDFRLTNEAVLGALMDDNSMPLPVLQGKRRLLQGRPLGRPAASRRNDGRAEQGAAGAGPLSCCPTDPGTAHRRRRRTRREPAARAGHRLPVDAFLRWR